MKSVRFVLAGIALLSAVPAAFAEVDYTCQSKCMDMGYVMELCTEKCTYGQRQGSNNGYQPSGALGAFQQGQRAADAESMQQLELMKRRLEIEKMKQELEMMRKQQR